MGKATARATAALAVLLAAAGCSYEPVTGGTVTNKDTYTYTTTVRSGSVPIIQVHEGHTLTVRLPDATSEDWSVTDGVYESCSIGQTVDRTDSGQITCR